MSVINTNVKALVAQQALTVNNRALGSAMEQLSTGKRINSAADDSAGLAIANRMTSQIRGLSQAVRNANDGISMLQTAEGSMVEVTNMLQRMRELAIQSATSTNGNDDRKYLNLEYQQLKTEIGRITSVTTWNGMKLLDGTNATQTFHVGAGNDTKERISVDVGTLSTMGTSTAGTVSFAAGSSTTAATNAVALSSLAQNDVVTLTVDGATRNFTLSGSDASAMLTNLASDIAAASITGVASAAAVASTGVLTLTGPTTGASFSVSVSVSQTLGVFGNSGMSNILSMSEALNNVTSLDTAISAVNQKRGELGAYMNRLNYTINNLTNISTNAQASRSRVQDTDYAMATSELARTQIIQQAATAILAQANQQPQMVLSLLK